MDVPGEPEFLADHDGEFRKVRLSDDWSIWPYLWVRSAGFPIDKILELAAPELSKTIDELLDVEVEWSRAEEEALEVLDQLIKSNHPEFEKLANKARRKIWKGTVPANASALGPAEAAVAALEACNTKRGSLLDELESLYSSSEQRIVKVLAEIAKMPLLGEAMSWQNFSAAEVVLPRVQDSERKLNSEQRRFLHTVAAYLQRYCTKNDTIGFFGPICWGRIVEGDGTCEQGEELLAHREVFFAGWAIDSFAARLSEDSELKPHLCPRRMPTVAVDGDVLNYGVNESAEAPAEVVWLLENATGETSALELARQALEQEDMAFEDESEVLALLEDLEEQELVIWRLQVPHLNPYSQRVLRKQLEAIGGPAKEAIAKLDELEADRQALARAAGDAAATADGIRKLNRTFERVSGVKSTRNAGQTYGARTIVFEDCARNLELGLPRKLIEGIGPALSLLLQSARWSTWEIAARYRKQFDSSFEEFGRERVRYTEFLHAINPYLPVGSKPQAGSIIDEVVQELRRRWMKILVPAEHGGQAISLRSEEIADTVKAAFDAPGPGWPAARFASPDLMMASKDLLGETPPLFVVGEFNPGANYVFTNAITPPFCDIASIAHKAFEAEVSGLAQTVYEEGGRAMNRLTVASNDVSVESGVTLAEHPRSQVLAIADLYVERRGRNLMVVDSASGRSYDVIAFHCGLFWEPLCTSFGFVGGEGHIPRVTVDSVVVSRESWRFGSDDVAFSQESKAHQRFLGAQRWRRKNKLPRLIFARLDSERKPVYIDLDSPMLVESFCNLLKGAKSLKVTEMLPAPDQFWLSSPQGGRYASELRTVIVDRADWVPPT